MEGELDTGRERDEVGSMNLARHNERLSFQKVKDDSRDRDR